MTRRYARTAAGGNVLPISYRRMLASGIAYRSANSTCESPSLVRTFLIRRPTRPRSRPPALTAPSSRSVGSAGMAMIASLFTGVTPSYRQKPNHISAINVCGMLAASFSGTKSGSFSQGGFNQLGRFGDNRKQHTVSHINFSSLLPAF